MASQGSQGTSSSSRTVVVEVIVNSEDTGGTRQSSRKSVKYDFKKEWDKVMKPEPIVRIPGQKSKEKSSQTQRQKAKEKIHQTRGQKAMEKANQTQEQKAKETTNQTQEQKAKETTNQTQEQKAKETTNQTQGQKAKETTGQTQGQKDTETTSQTEKPKEKVSQTRRGQSSKGPKSTHVHGIRRDVRYPIDCLDCGQKNVLSAKKCSKCKSERLELPRFNNGKPRSKFMREIIKFESAALEALARNPPPSTDTAANKKSSSTKKEQSSSASSSSNTETPVTSSSITSSSMTSSLPSGEGTSGTTASYTTTIYTKSQKRKVPAIARRRKQRRKGPISCICCHKIRTSGQFDCRRCGRQFSVNRLGPTEAGGVSREEASRNGLQSLLRQFSSNLVKLEVVDKLTPALSKSQTDYRRSVKSAENELRVAENKYISLLEKKETKEKLYGDVKLELDVLVAETESYNCRMVQLAEQETQVKKECINQLTNFNSSAMDID